MHDALLVEGSVDEIEAVVADTQATMAEASRVVLAGFELRHILADGSLESMAAVTDRILAATKLPPADLFRSREELEVEAFRRRGEKVAWASVGEGVAETGNPYHGEA